MCLCFPEVTSLANGPVRTPDSRAAVTRLAAELLLCLPHRWLAALGTLSITFHLSQLKATKQRQHPGEPYDGHELVVSALKKKRKKKKSTQTWITVLSSVDVTHQGSVFVGRHYVLFGGFLNVFLL